MKAKIFRPSKTAMQSGRAKEKSWKLIIDDGSHQTKDPLIGWNGGANTKSQINLFFSSKEKAINYAERHKFCLLYTSPSPRDRSLSRMPSSA